MQDPHSPVGSGFDAGTTVQDVLEGVDLAGTTVLLTGSYSGIGLATTKALSAAGATVLVPARRTDVAARRSRASTGSRSHRWTSATPAASAATPNGCSPTAARSTT